MNKKEKLFRTGIEDGFDGFVILSESIKCNNIYKKGIELGKITKKNFKKLKASKSYKNGFSTGIGRNTVAMELENFCITNPTCEEIKEWLKGWEDSKEEIKKLISTGLI